MSILSRCGGICKLKTTRNKLFKNNLMLKKNEQKKFAKFFSKREKPNYSKEFLAYKKRNVWNKVLVVSIQIALLVLFVVLWEVLAKTGAINVFITSSPSRIWATIKDLVASKTLFTHIGVTLYEATLGFLIATFVGAIIAIILWWNETIRKVLDPYIVVINSLPKIALGPILIVWVGIGTKAIVAMDILIMIVITIISMLNSFTSCDQGKIMLMKSMRANKFQILFKLILPNSLCDFISVLKINVGLTWVGTIMGEYLASKAGLGYLIVYGGQVFKLDLVMASTVILCVLAAIMYFVVAFIEKQVYKHREH